MNYLLDESFQALDRRFRSWGFKNANSKRIFNGLHRHGIDNYEAFEGQYLPRKLLDRLNAGAIPIDPIADAEIADSEDGSSKALIQFRDGQRVEAVYMPFKHRNTICISSQVGCALACSFCATGKMGLSRSLSAGEMVSQVYYLLNHHPNPDGRSIRANVVFMGMGEPLHNIEKVMTAFDILTHQEGLGLPQRDVAISTAGLVPGIEALARHSRRPHLMVSIGATTDTERDRMMPINRAYPLETLIKCLERYPLRKRERIILSYVLIENQNDSMRDADRLAAMSGRFDSMVNLIPFNAHPDLGDMQAPPESSLTVFYQRLLSQGVFATVRRSRGRDVLGACGQLKRNRERKVSCGH